jgi:probable O-glycosylation ligase (exosortase A-associated)
MRDLVVFGLVMASLPFAFRRPFIGLLVFSWLAYMRPQDLCWGFARNMRLSFFVGVTMVIGWIAHENGLRPFWRKDIRTMLMMVLMVLVTISLTMARTLDSYVLGYFVEFGKIILIAAFTTGQVHDRRRYEMLLWTIALSLGFYGFKGGLFGLATGGAIIQRGPGGMLEDNNDFALALVMNIPLLFYLGKVDGRRAVRWFTLVTIGLTMITVVLTHSRGAFLSGVVVLLVIAWRSGKLFQAVFGLLFVIVMFFLLVPQHVVDRLSSIREGDADSSALARFKAWQVAWEMIQDNPVWGVGLRNFQDNYYLYGDKSVYNHVAHNSYLQIWAEGGTPAFIVYLTIVASVFFACRRVRKIARVRPDLAWTAPYAAMLEATMCGFLVGSFFLNRGHFDLIYHWFALTSCLALMAAAGLRQRTSEAPAAAPAGGITVRWRSPAVAPLALARWGRSL